MNKEARMDRVELAVPAAQLRRQRGGTLLGFILGLLIGLGVALGVAIYITKVPVPFMNKASNRTPEQDAAEDKKNKDWDPNAPLYGKNPVRAPEKADGEAPAEGAASDKPKDAASRVDPKSTDPIADLARASEAKPKAAEVKPADKADSSDPFVYYVQAGAYRSNDEAETQRARLGMLGLEAKVSERDQGGRTVYRVRIGPLNAKTEAEKVRDKLEAAHIDSAMVRVQR